MTVIAWDGVTLAADRQVTFGETPTGPIIKIWRSVAPDCRVFLCGAAGNAHDFKSFRAWINGGAMPSGFTDSFSAMVIDQRKRIWYRSKNDTYEQIKCPHWAIGSGADYALGAMAAGATAVQAIKIASKLDVWCGFGVSKLTF